MRLTPSCDINAHMVGEHSMTNYILEVKDFTVSFNTYAGEVQAVREVSFEVARNEIIAIVGESGSGKSVMTQSIMKLLPSPPAVIKGGSVIFDEKEISSLNFSQLRNFKGKEIAYILLLNNFQTLDKSFYEMFCDDINLLAIYFNFVPKV